MPFDTSRYRCAVVDLETSGLRPSIDDILQVGIVHQSWSGVTDTQWSTYVAPPRRFRGSLGPTHVHGITRRKVVFAPRLAKVMSEVAARTSGCVVVAHNAAFDVGFLRAAAERCGVRLEWAGTLCTLALSRRLGERGQGNHKLATLCDEFGVSAGHAHHALDDARAAGAILPHLLERLAVHDDEHLRPYLRS